MKIKKRIILDLLKCITLTISLSTFAFADEINESLLASVISENFSDFLQFLKDGADPNYISTDARDGWIMCEVTKKNRSRFLAEVMKFGGDVNARNSSGSISSSAPLLCAIRHHNFTAVEYLVENGANIDINACISCSKRNYKPVTVAAVFNEYKMVDFLLNIDGPKQADMEKIADMISTRPIADSSPNYVWQEKVIAQLRANGLKVVPWTN